MWLLANWRILGYGLAALLLAFGVWKISDWREKASQLDAKSAELSKCYSDQQVTKELSLEYQKKISTVESRLAESKRVRPNVCVPVSTTPNSIIRTDTAKLSGQNGISAWSLIDFAGDAQKVNERAALCKSFLEKFAH